MTFCYKKILKRRGQTNVHNFYAQKSKEKTLIIPNIQPVWPDWEIFKSNLVSNFLTKVAQIFCDFLGYFETPPF